MALFDLDASDDGETMARAALQSAHDDGASMAALERIAARHGVAWGITWTGAVQVIALPDTLLHE